MSLGFCIVTVITPKYLRYSYNTDASGQQTGGEAKEKPHAAREQRGARSNYRARGGANRSWRATAQNDSADAYGAAICCNRLVAPGRRDRDRRAQQPALKRAT